MKRFPVGLLVLLLLGGASARGETLGVGSPLSLIGGGFNFSTGAFKGTGRNGGGHGWLLAPGRPAPGPAAGAYSDSPFVQPSAGDLRPQAAGFLDKINPVLASYLNRPVGPTTTGGLAALADESRTRGTDPPGAVSLSGDGALKLVPEPAALALFGLTAAALAASSRRAKLRSTI